MTRSRLAARAKVDHLEAHPDRVLRITRESGVKTFLRYDPDADALWSLTLHPGVTGTPRRIAYWRAAELAREGEIDYVSRAYYEATKCPADREAI